MHNIRLRLVLTSILFYLIYVNCVDLYQEVDMNDVEENDFEYKFEGDTILNRRQVDILVLGNGIVESRFGKNAKKDYAKKWPKKTVVYAFAKGHFSLINKKTIIKSMKAIQNKTCITFRPKVPTDKNFVLIRNGEFCLSRIGYIGRGSQTLMLSKQGCLTHGTIVHELLHTIGFVHMHNHPKRNTYVKIVWGNIQQGQRQNFRINHNMNNFGVPYDYKSIMHYGAKEFSKNGKPTIISKFSNTTITDNQSMSKGDLLKIKKMYYCP